MSLKYVRGALSPSQGYVCFSCRLQSLRITNSHRPRYQHAEASQAVSNVQEDAVQSQNAKTQNGAELKSKEGSSSRKAQPSDDGGKNKVC